MTTKKQAAAAAARANAPTASFEVLSPLDHDGVSYEIGDTVELTEDQALAVGSQVVKPIPAANA